MGNPCFYYYPVAGGALQKIDLGTLRLSDLLITPIRAVADTVSRAGTLSRDVGGMRLQVQIVAERFSNDTLVRQLRNMGNHLERGGSVGFTLDTAKLWAGFVDPSPIYQGATTLSTPGSNSWSSWSAGTLADDDPIVIQSAPPESVLEHHTANGSLSATGFSVAVDNATGSDFLQGPILVRYRDFWPALKMAGDEVRALAERDICQSHRRLNHTLDVTLVEDWGTIRSMVDAGAPDLPGETAGSPVRFQQMGDPLFSRETAYPTVHPY